MKQKVIVITGPTGVGKTKISIQIAKYLNTDIINGDAFQVYKKMDIGTAKIKEDEKEFIKHHLIDIIDPLDNFSINDYQKIVRALIEQLHTINKIPLIVGGSGLYIDSVLYDYQFKEAARDPQFELKYQNLDNYCLWQQLALLDKSLADSIHPNNRKRVLRAIELLNTNDKEINRHGKDDLIYDALIIFLTQDRDCLYAKINNRVDQMFNEGLLEEVKSLYPDKLSFQSLKAIGYSQLFDYFDHKCSLEEAKEAIKKASRHYAKRQITWFRNHPNVNFINVDNFDTAENEIINLINNFINTK